MLRYDENNVKQPGNSSITQATREVSENFLTMATPQQSSAHNVKVRYSRGRRDEWERKVLNPISNESRKIKIFMD